MQENCFFLQTKIDSIKNSLPIYKDGYSSYLAEDAGHKHLCNVATNVLLAALQNVV